MGYRLTQRIYSCDVCGKTPEDGEYMWHMGNEIWCEECCDGEGDSTDCWKDETLMHEKKMHDLREKNKRKV